MLPESRILIIFVMRDSVAPPSVRSKWIRSSFAFARAWNVWLRVTVCFPYLQDSHKRSLASDILILILDVNRLTSSLLRWPRRWYYYYRIGTCAFVFLFLFLGPLLLLAADGSKVNVVIFVGRSEVFCADDVLGFSYIVNAAVADSIVALVYGIGKRISYNILFSAIRTVLLPIYNIYSKNSQSNVNLWGRRSINIIRLMPNVKI
jgi:hypothetical protein